ncbi:MAG: SPOR domain-containing protein [Pseudomonadota bacterium]
MADFTFDDRSGPFWAADDVAESARVTEWLNWAGAALSLLLILGLGFWGWQLMQRDVSGVPVVQALEGPMRIAPEDPGGQRPEHQGLAVNQIAAQGTAEPPVETIVLAPAPLSLTDEDRPAAELALAPEPELSSTRIEEPAQVELSASPANATDMAVAEALASIEAGDLEIATEEIVATPSATGLSRSPLPRPRPLPLTNVAALSSDGVEVVPTGARLVQLGAFENADLAEAAWADTEGKFADYMVGKSMVIQEAETSGLKFYRLRAAGFDDLADARRFCSVLVAGDVNCIPVVQR